MTARHRNGTVDRDSFGSARSGEVHRCPVVLHGRLRACSEAAAATVDFVRSRGATALEGYSMITLPDKEITRVSSTSAHAAATPRPASAKWCSRRAGVWSCASTSTTPERTGCATAPTATAASAASAASAEDADPTGADQGADDHQQNAEQQVALQDGQQAGDDEQYGDDPEN